MVKHCIEVSHGEFFSNELFLFFRQNMTTEERNTCSDDVIVRIASINESEVDNL